MRRINPDSVNTWISNYGISSRSYRRFCKIDGEDCRFSHVVWNWYNPRDKKIRGDGFIIHHRDKDTLNDDINNLEKMKHSSHSTLHDTGRILSEESRKKMSKSLTGKIQSEETRRKKSESHKGEKNINYGKSLPVSVRRKLSKLQKERFASSPDAKKRLSEIRRLWWENLRKDPIAYGKHILKRKRIFSGVNNPKYRHGGRYKKTIRIVVKPPQEV